MARGRMLNNSISVSKKFNDLPDDTCRLLATWLISHLDKNGVFHADPMIVRSTIFTRRSDVTAEQVEGYLQAMENVGLVVLFEARGELWQWWPGFVDEQVGLRADRETTKLPIPPDRIPQDGGNLPEDSRKDADNLPAEEKLSEEKLSEEKIPPSVGADAPPPEEPPPKKPPKPSPARAMFSALAALCQVDIAACTDDQRGALNQSESRLRKAGATPDALGVTRDDWPTFAYWWYRYDWRGKKGEVPKPHQVREEWGKFASWRDAQRAPSVEPPERAAPTPDELLWQDILTDVRGRMARETFEAHLLGSVPVGRDGDCLRVALTRAESAVWLRERLYDGVLRPCVEQHAPGLNVEFVCTPQ